MQKNKLTQKIILIFACFSLLMAIVNIKETYGKYKTDVDGESSISIARWRILVNNQDVRNNSGVTTQITPTFLGTNNVASSVIAPGAEGYFDIVIDCSETDVSFNYTLTTLVSDSSAVDDLQAYAYQINGGTSTPFHNGDLLTNNVLNNSNIDSITIRVYIVWKDDTESTMNNAADTATTTDNTNKAIMDVSLSFKQII